MLFGRRQKKMTIWRSKPRKWFSSPSWTRSEGHPVRVVAPFVMSQTAVLGQIVCISGDTTVRKRCKSEKWVDSHWCNQFGGTLLPFKQFFSLWPLSEVAVRFQSAVFETVKMTKEAKDGLSTFLLHSLAGWSLGKLNFCTIWEGLSSGFWQTGGRLTLMHLCKQKLLWVRRPVLSLQVSGTSLRGHPRWVSFIISGHTHAKTRGRPIAQKSSLL